MKIALDKLEYPEVISDTMEQQITQGSFKIEFPSDMTQEEIKWVQKTMFKFLERHSCKVVKNG